MGNRVSISFKYGNRESPSLFSHWDGMRLVAYAKRYTRELVKEVRDRHTMPLDRLEPSTVMLDFIRELLHDRNGLNNRIESNYYLGKDSTDGDNGLNGHHVIDLKEWENRSELEIKIDEVTE